MDHIEKKSITFPEIKKEEKVIYPILVTAKWCPYTLPAIRFWEEACRCSGLPLRIYYAGHEHGDKIVVTANVAGVPCLIANPKTLYYGLKKNLSEASSFLKKEVYNRS
jgi:hypothetical protein